MFLSVFTDVLWVAGLIGVIATLSYANWQRETRRWRWKTVLSLPRYLTPLCLSLTLLSGGLCLAGATGHHNAATWETIIWGVITILFAIQVAAYSAIGTRRGWSAPIEGANES